MTAVSSPRIFVLKISEEYLFILSETNFPGLPNKKSSVSPKIGHPKLPGGRFLALWDECLKAKMLIASARTKRTMDNNKHITSMTIFYAKESFQ
jgi:hypothetical protein